MESGKKRTVTEKPCRLGGDLFGCRDYETNKGVRETLFETENAGKKKSSIRQLMSTTTSLQFACNIHLYHRLFGARLCQDRVLLCAKIWHEKGLRKYSGTQPGWRDWIGARGGEEGKSIGEKERGWNEIRSFTALHVRYTCRLYMSERQLPAGDVYGNVYGDEYICGDRPNTRRRFLQGYRGCRKSAQEA